MKLNVCQVMYLEDHDMIHFVDGHYHLYNHRTSDDLPENRVLQNLEIELDKISKGALSTCTFPLPACSPLARRLCGQHLHASAVSRACNLISLSQAISATTC